MAGLEEWIIRKHQDQAFQTTGSLGIRRHFHKISGDYERGKRGSWEEPSHAITDGSFSHWGDSILQAEGGLPERYIYILSKRVCLKHVKKI